MTSETICISLHNNTSMTFKNVLKKIVFHASWKSCQRVLKQIKQTNLRALNNQFCLILMNLLENISRIPKTITY
jgi:hypothetical protein